jgi:hypothetical protein
MTEELKQQIRHAFEQVDAAAPPHDLPASRQVWSRLQFQLAYRPRGNSYSSHTGILLVALYLFGFLMWMSWSGWLSASLVAVLASAAAASGFLCLHVSRRFRI